MPFGKKASRANCDAWEHKTLGSLTGTNSDIKHSLLKKIEDGTALIGVVGLGYVGLPFAVEKQRQRLLPALSL